MLINVFDDSHVVTTPRYGLQFDLIKILKIEYDSDDDIDDDSFMNYYFGDDIKHQEFVLEYDGIYKVMTYITFKFEVKTNKLFLVNVTEIRECRIKNDLRTIIYENGWSIYRTQNDRIFFPDGDISFGENKFLCYNTHNYYASHITDDDLEIVVNKLNDGGVNQETNQGHGIDFFSEKHGHIFSVDSIFPVGDNRPLFLNEPFVFI